MKRSLAVLVVLLASFLVRGFAFFEFSYPTGADYGHHTYFADLYLEEGRFPAHFPFYQLGQSRWSNMPGAALTFALLGAVSGTSAFEVASLASFFGVIEVAGVYLLGLRVFGRFDAALLAALVCGLVPAGATMAAWSGYANLLALALMPYAFVAWLDYWRSPSVRHLIVTAITVCGVASIHHLSTLWLGLTIALFVALQFVLEPRETARKLWPLGLAVALIGVPVLWRMVALFGLFSSGAPAGDVDPFAEVRVSWNDWFQLASASSLVILPVGMTGFLLSRRVHRDHRLLLGIYLTISFLLAFSWSFGFHWYYVRALYFLSIPIALGTASLLFLWPSGWTRLVAVLSLLTILGVGTLLRADSQARYYEILSPGVLEGVDWLRDFSEPQAVVVSGGFLGFHLPRLLARPILVGLSPDLVGNPDDVEAASDAQRILLGGDDMDEAIRRRDVQFVFLRARGEDVPDPRRSRAVFSKHRGFALLFRNEDVLVYGRLSRSVEVR
jgi:hypothetical protein